MRETIFNDIIKFLKNGEKQKVIVLRMLKSAVLELEREKKEELNDEDMLQAITKQIKTRKESIEQFKNGNRLDLVEKTEAEIEILSKYLPLQLDEIELDKIIDETIDFVKPTSIKDIGQVMAVIIPKIKGRADVGLVNQKIKAKFGG